MKHEELKTGLTHLFLHAIAREYAQVAKAHEKASSSYEQYLAALVTLEISEKDRQRTARLIKDAKIPLPKLIGEFEFRGRSGISSAEVARLCTGDFISKAGNVVFYGSFGVGKSHLAMALTRCLCEKGFRCLFTSAASLVNDLVIAQKNLTLSSLFKRLDRYDLITIDELGYIPQSQEGADLFFQLISHRYERKSLLFTTNLTYSEWDKVFLNKTATAAAIDRIVHNCDHFHIQGPSWRAETAKRKISKPAHNEVADKSKLS